MLSLLRTSGCVMPVPSRLDSPTENYLRAGNIAARTDDLLPCLLKLFLLLTARGLGAGRRGCRGGPHRARPAEAVESRDPWPRRLAGLAERVDGRHCPTYDFRQAERERIRRELARVTSTDIANHECRRGGRLPKRFNPG